MINWNTEPYNDDFDENNKFHRILFRPSYAVQARELTQLQSILQDQIKKNGDHLFKQGAMVIPGQISMDTEYHYVKIQPTYGAENVESYVEQFEGKIVTGAIGGVTALVLKVEQALALDPITLYVKYTNSGTDGVTRVFAESEELTTISSGTVITYDTSATGIGSAAIIERGVYYVNGYYVLCDKQTLLLDKYTNEPTYRVGLTVDEQKITPEDDETLLDNAQTSFNYAAPGAHRYYIDLILSKLTLDDAEDDSFIELLQVLDGRVTSQISRTEYAELEKTMARRTYDESGDYTITDFTIDVREHRNNNRGQWLPAIPYRIGDVVTNAEHTYVARISATSASIAPVHLTGSEYDSGGATGVEWEYNESPLYNRGVYTSGQLTGITLTNPGSGYITAPTVSITGGGGTGAKAVTEIKDGKVISITIKIAGHGYTSHPTVTLVGSNATEATATAFANFGDESKLAIGLEPGKAYVRGYEIEKVGKEYLTIDKSRDFVQVDNAIIPATVGNYILVTNVYGIPSVGEFVTVNLYDRITSTRGAAPAGATVIGTCRVRGMEWDNGTIGSVAAIYKLSIFNVTMNNGWDFNRDVKGFFISGFSADISPVTTNITGTYTYSFPGSVPTITGQGTSFQTDLSVGDYIYLGTDLRRVATLTAQNTLTIDAAISTTGLAIKLATTEVKEPQNSGLVFPFPYYAIKSVRSVNNTNDTTYTVTERFTGQVSGGTLSITTSRGTFASSAETDNYLFTNAGGDIVLQTGITGTGTSTITVTIASGTYTVLATINCQGGNTTEKTKTVTVVTDSTSFNDKAKATKSILSLGKADIIKVTSIKMMSGNFASPPSPYSIDISDRYIVDNGQRDSYYGIGTLNLIPSFNAPEAPIEVTYEYFAHGAGDYFTVNSYPADFRYENIDPTLRDAIDFRPTIDDNGTTFTLDISSNHMPKRGLDIRADYEYYLARRDKIVLNFAGVFSDVKGSSALNPGFPESPSLSMTLYNLSLEPYTFTTDTDSVKVEKIDNKRYTMRDIGKLEKRIDNLEYYTSLSLLEQQTESLAITDSAGLNRFKNGFVVDSFTGHGVGDTASQDYICAVDAENAELRPFYTMDNVNLVEKNTGNAGRVASNYKLYGDVITLPVIDHVKLAEQKYGSRLENVNPFAVFTFLGDVKLNPSSDEWFEVSRRPDIIQEVEGNFNLMKTLAEKAGVLGTIWGAWKNTWVGTPVSKGKQTYNQGSGRAFLNALNPAGNRYVSGGGSLRKVEVETFVARASRSRTGVKSEIVAKIDNKIVEDKVLSTAVIPYIRSRNILAQIRGLKPATRFYPFFDGVDVSTYCTPATILILKNDPVPGVFNTDQNVGGDISETSRMISGDSQVCLNKGDVVFVASRSSVAYTKETSPATAVVVGKDYNMDTGTKTLHLANVKGSFLANDIIQGSISSATATISIAPTVATIGQSLLTNFAGELSFLFNIPNTEAHRFRTGNKEFKLIDVSTVDGVFTSRGRTQYNAVGILETKQATVQATRNAELVQTQITVTEPTTVTSQRIISDTGWYDPLAQTFLVDCKGGAFISKIDTFFATKDTKVPVTIQIREVVNGYPGKRILPFSTVTLYPEQINLSSTLVTLEGAHHGIREGTQVPKYDTPTTFTFPSPVFVQDSTEYCIVLLSDCINYNVWISNMGDKIPGSSGTISEQPYNGVFFKSQNASTWTADQNQDLKFVIYRAKFDTSVVGNVEFVNDMLPYKTLDIDPIEVKSGTNTLRVWHADHGMPVGSTVQLTNSTAANISGVAGAGTITCGIASTAVAGVDTVFNTTVGAGTVLYNAAGVLIGVVASVTDNLNLVLVANAAVAVAGGAYYIAVPIAGIPVTEIYNGSTGHVIGNVDLDSYTITTTTSANTTGYFGGITVRATQNMQFDSFHPIAEVQSFTETQINYGMKTTTGKSVDGSQTPYTLDQSFRDCLANETNTLFAPAMVASAINETKFLSGNKSLAFSAQISSTNNALSPIIDTHRFSLVAISNKVDSPSESNMNVAALDIDALLTSDITIAFTTATNACVMSSADPTAIAALKTIQVGKYVTIDIPGVNSPNSVNEGTWLVTKVDATTGDVTLYTTGATLAASNATTISVRKMFVDEIAPVGSSTHSKYVSKIINLENPSSYIRTKLAANIPDGSDLLVYYKTIGVGSVHSPETMNWTLFSPDKEIIKAQVGNETFTDIDYSIVGLRAFDAIQIKLVMKSTNSSAVPRVKDLRIIACA